MDNVVLTAEGAWGPAENHHDVTIMSGCGCNYVDNRDIDLDLQSLQKKKLVSYDNYRVLSRNFPNCIGLVHT